MDCFFGILIACLLLYIGMGIGRAEAEEKKIQCGEEVVHIQMLSLDKIIKEK